VGIAQRCNVDETMLQIIMRLIIWPNSFTNDAAVGGAHL
jgi:hypothetical protein